MVTRTQQMTPEEAIAYIEAHDDTRFDFIDGELVEIPAKPLYGRIRAKLIGTLGEHLAVNRMGALYTGVLHVLEDVKLMPDISLNRKTAHDASYFTEAPLLAVEIRSDTQSRASQRRKAVQYIELGTEMVWLVMPDEGIEVYTPGNEGVGYGMDDTLSGEPALPGLTLVVKSVLGR